MSWTDWYKWKLLCPTLMIPPQFSVQQQVVRINDCHLDIRQLRLWLGQALKILTTGNSVVLLKRKLSLQGFLDQKFQNLLKPTNSMTQELLGPDLEQKILDGTRASEIGKCIAKRTRWSGSHFRMSRDRDNGRQSQRGGAAGRGQDQDFRARSAVGKGYNTRGFPSTGALKAHGSNRSHFGNDKKCGLSHHTGYRN